MAVGGFFLIFEPFRTESGSSRGATGETSRTAPESGHRCTEAAADASGGLHAVAALPGAWGSLARSRGCPVDRSGRRRGGAQRSDGVEQQ